MNKRIRELMEQAGGNPNYPAFRGHFLPPPPDYIDPATVDLEKFAQLIIQECCGILTENIEVALDASGSPVYPEGLIQEHFGVEE